MFAVLFFLCVGFTIWRIQSALSDRSGTHPNLVPDATGKRVCPGVLTLREFDKGKRDARLHDAYVAVAAVSGTAPLAPASSAPTADEPPPLPTVAGWFYEKGGERVGPIQIAHLKGIVASGELTPDALVWRKGMSDWQPFSTIS